MKRMVQQFMLTLALALCAPVAKAQDYFLLQYKGRSFVGHRIHHGHTFVTCRGVEVDLTKYPDLSVTPAHDGQGCFEFDSALDSDGQNESNKADQAQRKEIDEMLDQYDKDHDKDK